MFRNPFKVGDKVLASRLENGEDHEPGVVIDSYELLMGADAKPMVVVEFEDGDKKYLIGGPPNVLPAPVSEEDEEESSGEDAPEEAAPAEAEAEPEVADDARDSETAPATAESAGGTET